jgi:type II secretory pathway component PulF
MAISTSQKSDLSQVRPAPDHNKQASSTLEKLVQQARSLPLFQKSRQITEKERIFLFSQLALMLETGTPLNRSLVAITPQIKSPFFKSVIEDITKEIESGKNFSTAMTKYEKEFSPITINMMKAGEISGSLETMLNQAEQFEKKQAEFRAMVKRAMTYPLLLMVLSLGVIIFVLTFVFPKFADLFADVWEILPISTKILMGTSTFVLHYWYILLIGVTALIISAWTIITHKKVVPHMDRLKMVVPLIGNLYVMAYTSQMLRTLGFLIGGGVPLLEGLTTTRDTIRNTLYRSFIDRIITAAKDGKGIAYAFLQTAFLPETVKQVIKTGEDSGKLDFVMIRLSDYYDNEMEKQFKLLSTIIEPVALLIMGVVVGFIVMSIVLPIFKLSRAVH